MATSHSPRVSRKRHLAKTASYRLISTFVMCSLTWAVTGSLVAGLTVAILEFVIMFTIYYFHEIAWHKIKFGIQEEIEEALSADMPEAD